MVFDTLSLPISFTILYSKRVTTDAFILFIMPLTSISYRRGTPIIRDTFPSLRVFSIASAFIASAICRVLPTYSGISILPNRGNIWCSGNSTITLLFSLNIGTALLTAFTLNITFLNESITPLGEPVVPDVYIINIVSSAKPIGMFWASILSTLLVSIVDGLISVAPCVSIVSNSSLFSSEIKTTSGVQSFIIYSISFLVDWVSTGTTIALERSAPYSAKHH